MQAVSDDKLRKLIGRVRAVMASQKLTQADIAKRSQIKQPTVSRLLTGKRRTWSEDLRRLEAYINSEAIPMSPQLRESVETYLAQGGDATLLERTIDLIAHAQAVKVPSPKQ